MSELEIGGQAVIEGVLMRTKKGYAISVNTKKGIRSTKKKFVSITRRNKFLGAFFIRGIIGMVEMFILGYKGLNWSADQQTEKKQEKLTGLEIGLTWLLAIAFAIGFFVMIPLFATRALNLGNNFLFNLVDGVFRIALFILYVYIISLFKDVRRIFEYHGAEHKTVFAFENKEKLTYENIKKYSTKHPRCGTSFIMIVLIVAIILFTVVHSDNWIRQFLTRVAFIPVIAGLSYELLKFSGKYKNNFFVKILAAPGLAIQYITTKEPNKKQIETAVDALKKVLSIK